MKIEIIRKLFDCKIKNFAKIIFLLPVFITLQSCSSSEPYPTQWGDVYDTQKHGDSIISGNYCITGECTGARNFECSITNLIELPELNTSSVFDNIIINVINEDTLIIILRAKTDTVYRTVFPDNGAYFSFTDEGLKLDQRKSRGDLGIYLPLISNGSATLMKSTEGSLIVKSNVSSFGLIIMIPAYGSSTNWYKFKQYKND
jgi:hypothetical protein